MASSPSLLFFFLLYTFLLTMIASTSQAKEFLVRWKVPSSESESLNKWAESNRFQVGDSLVWKYDGKDSVLQVTRKDYLSCNGSSPIAKHVDVMRLRRSGPYYFIGGAEGACERGEKLIVVVMSTKTHRGPSPAPTPAAAAEYYDGPSVAPTSGGGSRRFLVATKWAIVAALLLVFQM